MAEDSFCIFITKGLQLSILINKTIQSFYRCLFEPPLCLVKPSTPARRTLHYKRDRSPTRPTAALRDPNTTSRKSEQVIQYCTDTALHRYSTAPIQYCTNTVLHRYSTAPIQNCTNTVLYRYSTAPIQNCTNTVLYQYSTAPTRNKPRTGRSAE